MKVLKNRELLQDPDVLDEIGRYKWVESQKLGADMGFDAAAKNWLLLYSDEWLKHRSAPVRTIKKSAKRFL